MFHLVPSLLSVLLTDKVFVNSALDELSQTTADLLLDFIRSLKRVQEIFKNGFNAIYGTSDHESAIQFLQIKY
jgi:hypothetical protein